MPFNLAPNVLDGREIWGHCWYKKHVEITKAGQRYPCCVRLGIILLGSGVGQAATGREAHMVAKFSERITVPSWFLQLPPVAKNTVNSHWTLVANVQAAMMAVSGRRVHVVGDSQVVMEEVRDAASTSHSASLLDMVLVGTGVSPTALTCLSVTRRVLTACRTMECVSSLLVVHRGRHEPSRRCVNPPVTTGSNIDSHSGDSGGAVVSALASNHGDPGLIPGVFAPGFSYVGIELDDAACRRVFSGYSHSPRPYIPAPLHPRVSFHITFRDDGHLRVPAGKPVTREKCIVEINVPRWKGKGDGEMLMHYGSSIQKFTPYLRRTIRTLPGITAYCVLSCPVYDRRYAAAPSQSYRDVNLITNPTLQAVPEVKVQRGEVWRPHRPWDRATSSNPPLRILCCCTTSIFVTVLVKKYHVCVLCTCEHSWHCCTTIRLGILTKTGHASPTYGLLTSALPGDESDKRRCQLPADDATPTACLPREQRAVSPVASPPETHRHGLFRSTISNSLAHRGPGSNHASDAFGCFPPSTSATTSPRRGVKPILHDSYSRTLYKFLHALVHEPVRLENNTAAREGARVSTECTSSFTLPLTLSPWSWDSRDDSL
ncbi:hypothetical protein PR048_020266 [Dryococelus australis]|uniref:RNase H type-1 domain-containing protein n=1 Tax=Dryococelus australis TaxID=614101 RepID=A0ABQ9H5W4_9NEOP|nr:hypothetical protein PR048_020266 [Dryococelus australis]